MIYKILLPTKIKPDVRIKKIYKDPHTLETEDLFFHRENAGTLRMVP